MLDAIAALLIGAALMIPVFLIVALLEVLHFIGDGFAAVLASIRRDRERRRTYRGLRRDVWTRDESKEDEDWFDTDYYGGTDR